MIINRSVAVEALARARYEQYDSHYGMPNGLSWEKYRQEDFVGAGFYVNEAAEIIDMLLASGTVVQLKDLEEHLAYDNEVVEAAAKEAFRVDDLGGHVKGDWSWETIPAVGRRNYRALVVGVLRAAARELARKEES